MKLFYAISVPLLIISCGPEGSDKIVKDSITLDGKKLMEDRCYSCHNTQGTDNMLAPPMFRVKDHYWDEETSKEEFVSDIVEWVMDPKEENSIMPGARRKFGLMPKQEFDKDEVKAIAEYMYDHNLDGSCEH